MPHKLVWWEVWKATGKDFFRYRRLFSIVHDEFSFMSVSVRVLGSRTDTDCKITKNSQSARISPWIPRTYVYKNRAPLVWRPGFICSMQSPRPDRPRLISEIRQGVSVWGQAKPAQLVSFPELEGLEPAVVPVDVGLWVGALLSVRTCDTSFFVGSPIYCTPTQIHLNKFMHHTLGTCFISR